MWSFLSAKIRPSSEMNSTIIRRFTQEVSPNMFNEVYSLESVFRIDHLSFEEWLKFKRTGAEFLAKDKLVLVGWGLRQINFVNRQQSQVILQCFMRMLPITVITLHINADVNLNI